MRPSRGRQAICITSASSSICAGAVRTPAKLGRVCPLQATPRSDRRPVAPDSEADGRGRAGADGPAADQDTRCGRSEEHTSELQSLMRNPYAVFCLKKKKEDPRTHTPRPAPTWSQNNINQQKTGTI